MRLFAITVGARRPENDDYVVGIATSFALGEDEADVMRDGEALARRLFTEDAGWQEYQTTVVELEQGDVVGNYRITWQLEAVEQNNG